MDQDCIIRGLKVGDKVIFAVKNHQYYGAKGVITIVSPNVVSPEGKYIFVAWNHKYLQAGGWYPSQVQKIKE